MIVRPAVPLLLLCAALTACDSETGASSLQAAAGSWGGQGIELHVLADGRATIDYGCDSGTIEESLPVSGRFESLGTHTFGSGGPREPNSPAPVPHVARYDGTIAGDTMTVSIVVPALSRRIGEFSLQLNRRAVLERCG